MKKLIYIVLLIAVSFSAMAQNNGMLNLFYTNPYTVMPSYAGVAGKTFISAHYRNQYADFSGAPVTQLLAFNHSFDEKSFALGARVYNDRLGLINNSGFEFSYSYKVDLNETMYLRMGLAAQIGQSAINFDNAVLNDPDEAIATGMLSSTIFDGSAGVTLHAKSFEIGIAVPQLMQSSIDFEGENLPEYFSYQNVRAYQFYGSIWFNASDKIRINPVTFVRFIPGTGLTYDLAAIATFNELIQFGVGYHNNYALSATAGINVNSALAVNYNYTFPINDIALASYGGHEIALSYSIFPKAKAEKGKKEESKKITEVNNRLFEQELVIIKQTNDIDVLKRSIKGEQVEEELLELQNESEQMLKENSGSEFFVVLGSFADLSTASEYQRALKRYNSKLVTKVVKEGNLFLIYQKSYSDAAQAKKEVSSNNKESISIQDPWIFVKQ
ncbi:MAG: PorP/SprF family type IX secretion system membrane protein [Bacteroidia bacterium]